MRMCARTQVTLFNRESLANNGKNSDNEPEMSLKGKVLFPKLFVAVLGRACFPPPASPRSPPVACSGNLGSIPSNPTDSRSHLVGSRY